MGKLTTSSTESPAANHPHAAVPPNRWMYSTALLPRMPCSFSLLSSYDEPELLSYVINSICTIGADDLHFTFVSHPRFHDFLLQPILKRLDPRLIVFLGDLDGCMSQ